jgi:hypothetical protein
LVVNPTAPHLRAEAFEESEGNVRRVMMTIEHRNFQIISFWIRRLQL